MNSVNTCYKFLFKAENKVGIFFNQAFVISLELFSDVFQSKIWSAIFYKTLDFDVQTT